ncbi:hypothetical protein FQR65_LT05836 [Abscondita terminalis]|nr:hypothetical protein FQR65_LT05836 [Abscondita terminalis]
MKYHKQTSTDDANPHPFASTPTGNYVLTPKTKVCPGILSKFVRQRTNTRLNSSVAIKEPRPKIKKYASSIIESDQSHQEVLLINSTQGASISLLKQSLSLNVQLFSFENVSLSLMSPSSRYIDVETSAVYVINLNKIWIKDVLTKAVKIDVCIQDDGKTVHLAGAHVKVSEVVNHPLAILQQKFCNVSLLHKLVRTPSSHNYGNFIIKASKNERKSVTYMYSKRRSTSTIENRTESESIQRFDNNLEPTPSETENFQEALDLVLARNKALRIAQSEISFQLQDRAKWLHEESNWKRTLQEHAILRGRDPKHVQWRQWRTLSTSKIKLHRYNSRNEINGSNVVVIKIEYVKFQNHSEPMMNDKIGSFYVEYTFLTHEIEYPSSVQKPRKNGKIIFDFEKSFSLDPEVDKEDCCRLAEAVKQNQNLIISVVGEPSSNVTGIPCCEEVCIGKVPLLHLIENTSNNFTGKVSLHERANERHHVGYLKVHIKGVLVMRKIALKLLAPSTYVLN